MLLEILRQIRHLLGLYVAYLFDYNVLNTSEWVVWHVSDMIFWPFMRKFTKFVDHLQQNQLHYLDAKQTRSLVTYGVL